jgi:WD repeat-containing protein 42A
MSYHLLYDLRAVRPTLIRDSYSERKRRARALELDRVLEGHMGCINSIEFSDDGTLLLTGSDDTNICLFSTLTWQKLATLETAHTRNIFNAAMVPHSGNTEIVSCGLDGKVCLCRIRENGESANNVFQVAENKVVTRSNAITSRLVFLEGQPRTAYVARSTGSVSVVDLRLEREVDQFYPAFADMSRSCNCIASSPVHPYVLACGTDLPPVCFVDVRKATRENASFLRVSSPMAMQSSGVGGLSFNQQGDKVVCSYKSSDVFAYEWTAALDHSDRRYCDPLDLASYPAHDYASQYVLCPTKRYVGRSNRLTMFKEAAYFDEDRYVVTGGDCGHVFVWDAETGKLFRKVKADSDIVNGVLTHPALPVIVACGIDDSAKVISVSDDEAYGLPHHNVDHTFNAPRTRRRFAAESDTDEETTEDIASDDVGDFSAEVSPASTGESSDSESLSLRHVARNVALCQVQVLEDDIPTRSGLLPHLRMVARIMKSIASSGMMELDFSDDEVILGMDSEEEEEEEEEEEHEEEEGELEEGEGHGAGEGAEAADHDDAAGASPQAVPTGRRARREALEQALAAEEAEDAAEEGDEEEEEGDEEEGGEVGDEDEADEEDDGDDDEPAMPGLDIEEATTEAADSSGAGRDMEGAEDSEILGMLLFCVQKYATYLGQVRSMCASRGLIGANESKVKFDTVSRDATIQFWTVLDLFADIVYQALDQKFVLASDETTRSTWATAFTDVCLVKSAIACAEGSPDRALAYLSNCATQTSWSLPLLSGTVATLHATGGSAALLQARVTELKASLASGHGTSEQRARARKLLRHIEA